MKLNRNTLLLIVVSIVVIVVAMIINNSPISAPDTNVTPSAETVSAPLFADVNAGTLATFEVRDNTLESYTVLGRSDEQTGENGELLANWVITDATSVQELDTDPIRAQTAVTSFAALNSVTSFPLDGELSAFGLDAPLYTLSATDSEAKTYTVKLGTTNNANRTYALVNEDAATIYVIRQNDLQPLLDLVFTPPYVPTPTPTATATSTPNPYSEVQQTQTAVAEQTAIAATLEALVTPEVTPDETGEATPEATP